MTCLTVMAQEHRAGQTEIVSHVQWLQDSNEILITLYDGGLFVVDATTQLSTLAILGDLTGPIEDAALQPNGSLIATVHRFMGLNLWDRQSGRRVSSISDVVFAWQVEWSSNGQWLFTGNANEMFLRDAAGIPILNVSYANEDIPVIAFSPNNEYLALSFSIGLQIYDLTTQQILAFNILPGLRQSIQWSNNGRAILAANINNRREGVFYNVVVFDALTGEIVRTYSDFPNQLTSARWSPDETQILATSIDGTAYLIDAASGGVTPIYTGDVPLLSADWSPYGGQVAIGAPARIEMTPSVTQDETGITNVPLQIIVPDPTLERLQAIAAACGAESLIAPTATDTLTDAALTDTITNLQNATADQVPPACAADLLAIAQALQNDR
jgi:WD40 repeat protein